MPNTSRSSKNNYGTSYSIPATLEEFNNPTWHARDIRRFDIAGFERGRHGSEWTASFHGANIRQLNNGSPENHYQEDISRPDFPYTYANVYDARGRLVMKAVEFYNLDIGDYVSYSTEGEVTHHRQAHDGLFIYPISDLIAQMRRCCQLDLLDTRRIRLSSTAGEVPPFYYVIYAWPTKDGPIDKSHGLEGYLVDAGNGALVYHMSSGIFLAPDGIHGSPYHAYTQAHAQETQAGIERNRQALERAAAHIQTFTDAPDERNTVFHLQNAVHVLEYDFSLNDIDTDPVAFTEQRRAWLILALQIIDLADRYTPPPLSDKTDPANFCLLNVLPPIIDGIGYPTPIDLAQIKDPALRAQYEQDIADNKRNCVRTEHEVTFSRLTGKAPDLDPKASFLARTQAFITAHYRPAGIMTDRQELHALMDQYLSTPERRQALRETLAIPALPGNAT